MQPRGHFFATLWGECERVIGKGSARTGPGGRRSLGAAEPDWVILCSIGIQRFGVTTIICQMPREFSQAEAIPLTFG